jgi:hypothetical protein
VKRIDWDALYAEGVDVEQEKFCTTDVCELPRAA